jgi:hypothetical protein
MENNFNLTGDEARILMAALASSPAALPIGTALMLYMRLAAVSNVQPPVEKKV